MPRADAVSAELDMLGNLAFKDPSRAAEVLERKRKREKHSGRPGPRSMLLSQKDRKELRNMVRRKHIVDNLDKVRQLLMSMGENIDDFLGDLDKEAKKNSTKWPAERKREQEYRMTLAVFSKEALDGVLARMDADEREGGNAENTANAVLDAVDRLNVYVKLRARMRKMESRDAETVRDMEDEAKRVDKESREQEAIDEAKALGAAAKASISKQAAFHESSGFGLLHLPVMVMATSKPQTLYSAASRKKAMDRIKSRTFTETLYYPVVAKLVLKDQLVFFLSPEKAREADDEVEYRLGELGYPEHKVVAVPQTAGKSSRPEVVGGMHRYWVRRRGNAKTMDGIIGSVRSWRVLEG